MTPSVEIDDEMPPLSIGSAKYQIAELTKIIVYFETKYGPFSDAEPVIKGLVLPARPLFLIDFKLRVQRLQEFVDRTKDAETREAVARS